MKRKSLPVLTALRFPAAAAIVLFHYLYAIGFLSGSLQNLSLGVSFFYVLSGFILYYNYSDLKDRSAFWVARVARIWPVHLVTCGLIVICVPFSHILGHAYWFYTLPLNLLLLQAWVPISGSVLSFNGVSWSLSVEAFFYFSFPWVLFMLKRWGAGIVFFGSFILGFLAVAMAHFLFPRQPEFGTYFPVCRLFEFVLGMITCHYWLQAFRPASNSRLWSAYEVGSLAVTGIFVFVVAPMFKQFIDFSPVLSWMMTLVSALCFSVIVWVFAHQAGTISRLLLSRAIVQLGEISFSLYMCHQIVLRGLLLREVTANAPREILFILYLTLSMILAYLLFYLVETPARHSIVDIYRRRAGSVPS